MYDPGGGTFDASVVKLDPELVEVLVSDGDTQLGGKDFDELLADWILDKFLDQQTDLSEAEKITLRTEVKQSKVLAARLILLAEKTKIQLSSDFSVVSREEFFCESPAGKALHIEVEISRPDF